MITLLLAATLCGVEPADTTITLNAVTVTGQQRRDYQMRSSQTTVQVNREFLNTNFAGSLMQTLEGIPGVKAMAIGSGQSKPVIRGLGFNRLAVVEDGIKHEGQQWGDDHGLEVRLSDIDYDRSRRDIDLPYQWVNHLKVLSHTTWYNEQLLAELNLAYQHNVREELAEPVSHGYMPAT